MTAVVERVFAARMAQLSDALLFVEEHGTRRGVARDDLLRLSLVVEELFTNTVVHGHGGDSDAPLRIVLGVADDTLTLHYEDSAPAFDPLAAPAGDLDGPLDARRPGGLGIALVRQMAATVRYAREDGCNRLWISLARAPG